MILLGRLSLYGERASRLHDEVLAVAARWTDADVARTRSKPYADATLEKTLDLLERTLERRRAARSCRGRSEQRLASGAARDLDELRPHLRRRRTS